MQRILIYGTGNIANEVEEKGIHGEVIGYIQSNPDVNIYNNKPVYSLNDFPDVDVLIVANSYCDEIYQLLDKSGKKLNNVIFYNECSYDNPREKLDIAKKSLSELNYDRYVSNRGIIEESFFQADKKKYEELNIRDTFRIHEEYNRPLIQDKYCTMGTIDDYFWESLWAAKNIINNKPDEHYDIGSRINGFLSTLLAAGIAINVIDVRPFPIEIEGMKTIVADATKLEHIADNSIGSLSAIDSLAHFGLGRYGDPVNPEACFECFENIQRVIKIGGYVYISVPIGLERVCFNAHRIFNPNTIVGSFSKMKLLEFSVICDKKLEKNVDLDMYDEYIGKKMARGLFIFKK